MEWFTEHCTAGQFYEEQTRSCVPCPADSYQPHSGLNYCIKCPGDTRTDGLGSTQLTQCKGGFVINWEV